MGASADFCLKPTQQLGSAVVDEPGYHCHELHAPLTSLICEQVVHLALLYDGCAWYTPVFIALFVGGRDHVASHRYYDTRAMSVTSSPLVEYSLRHDEPFYFCCTFISNISSFGWSVLSLWAVLPC